MEAEWFLSIAPQEKEKTNQKKKEYTKNQTLRKKGQHTYCHSLNCTVTSKRAHTHYTAWDSEIESLTSLNPTLIELDRRKMRRRHRVTAALAPRMSCFLPCNANLHASSASLKHGLPPHSFFEWFSFLAHRLVVITHAIVKLRCKKESVENWQQSTQLEKITRIFINPNTSLHSVVFLSTFRSDCAAFIRMTNGRLAETGTFKVFQKTSSSEDFTQ